MSSQRVKNKKVTTQDEVEWRDCCSLHAVTFSVIYYSTHTRKNVIYLFYTIKIQILIDHGQQPIKMVVRSHVIVKNK